MPNVEVFPPPPTALSLPGLFLQAGTIERADGIIKEAEGAPNLRNVICFLTEGFFGLNFRENLRKCSRNSIFFQNFEWPFTPRGWLRSASNFGKTRF